MNHNLHLDPKPKSVPFERLYLDPNNPRLGRPQPGYDDPATIFGDAVQQDLEQKIDEMYEISNLVEAILSQGWVPIDAILVWEHPKKKGHYVVAEGNSRTTALRDIRRRLAAIQGAYDQKRKKKGADPEVLKEMEEQIAELKAVVDATNEISVILIEAANTEELLGVLPRLLGVRHVTHAKEWEPYPRNLYIANLYRKMFHEQHGEKAKLRLDNALVKKVGGLVSLGQTKAKRNIQAAVAFSHFKERFEDRLPDGEKFKNDDQYFFENLLVNRFPREQFKWSDDKLYLDSEMEEVLFKWAFAKPRPQNKDNPNIFYMAENIRHWQEMKIFDDKNKTSFFARLDVNNPDTAVPMRELRAEFMQATVQQSPLTVLNQLLAALGKLDAATMRSQASHVTPVLNQVIQVAQDCLSMIKALAKKA